MDTSNVMYVGKMRYIQKAMEAIGALENPFRYHPHQTKSVAILPPGCLEAEVDGVVVAKIGSEEKNSEKLSEVVILSPKEGFEAIMLDLPNKISNIKTFPDGMAVFKQGEHIYALYLKKPEEQDKSSQ